MRKAQVDDMSHRPVGCNLGHQLGVAFLAGPPEQSRNLISFGR